MQLFASSGFLESRVEFPTKGGSSGVVFVYGNVWCLVGCGAVPPRDEPHVGTGLTAIGG